MRIIFENEREACVVIASIIDQLSPPDLMDLELEVIIDKK